MGTVFVSALIMLHRRVLTSALYIVDKIIYIYSLYYSMVIDVYSDIDCTVQ